MSQGKFVVIEGLEGAGKSSAIALVKERIESAGHRVINTREPGGTPMAEAIRECVKHNWQESVTTEAELLLMYAARAQLVANVIKPALTGGNWVLADRHDLSSQAYQGGGRQVKTDTLLALRDITLQGFSPDLTLYLDVDPKVGLARARGRGELDRIEQADLGFFQRTRERYLALCADDDKAFVIDAMQPIEQVQSEILRHLNAFMESL